MACLLLATATADVGKTLAGVLASGKSVSRTPKPGGAVLTIRKWNPKSPPQIDIIPKFVAVGESAKIRNGSGDWIIVSRSILKADLPSYVAAAKGAGTTGPSILLEFSRQVQPAEDDLTMVLECAAEAGITDIWLTRETPTPPRKLPVHPARPVAPHR